MFDLVCFCHLRWDFVYQRPQHLLTRFSHKFRVFYVEEPIFDDIHTNSLAFYPKSDTLCVVVPHLKPGLTSDEVTKLQRDLIDELFKEKHIREYILWYYTPMALNFSRHLKPELVVYDCMDELSNFKFAPSELKDREKELFEITDVAFTGGLNLFRAKQACHHNIHGIPSSIDKDHFAQAREFQSDPDDQQHIPHPRFGFYGVVDERFDLELISKVAELRPSWHFIIVGPVVKIDPATLPRLDNIHYLGGKSYEQLPSYLAGWDIALVPFLRNESTLYISPTKTPEYLAAGKPVISTSIVDVIHPYGEQGLVHIADDVEEFVSAAESELNRKERVEWLSKVDDHLKDNSWDNTWNRMYAQILKKLNEPKTNLTPLNKEIYV